MGLAIAFLFEFLGAMAFVFALLGYGTSVQNQRVIGALSSSVAKLVEENHNLQAQVRASQSNQKATLRFIGEINYICSVAGQSAAREGLPTPAPGLCALVVATPAP